MVRNGGWLDEVHFGVNTDIDEDNRWLDELVKDTKDYRKIDIGDKGLGRDGYNAMWATVDKEPMYIKMDDDILYFDDEAIPNLVYSKLKHPEALNIGANLINCPETGWLHYRFGAIHAYLPELSRPKERSRRSQGIRSHCMASVSIAGVARRGDVLSNCRIPERQRCRRWVSP